MGYAPPVENLEPKRAHQDSHQECFLPPPQHSKISHIQLMVEEWPNL